MKKSQVIQMRKLIVLGVALLFILGIYIGIRQYRSYKKAHQPFMDSVKVEINGDFDASTTYNNIPIEDQYGLVYEGNVDTAVLGDYPITYQYKGKTYKVVVKVVDTTPPELTCHEVTVRLDQEEYSAESFVESSSDVTKITYSILNSEKITKVGDYTMKIQATDEGGNSTVVETILHVIEPDLEAPVLTGLEDLTVKMNAEVNYYSKVYISDNLDTNPTYSVDHSGVDLTTPGTYQAIYHVEDMYGNTMDYPRNIIVSTESSQTSKVIYITFDDGPSKNTPLILDILNRYGIKATFFVTGNNPAYYDYLRIENDGGHAVAIHTFSHTYENIYASVEAYQKDFADIQSLIHTYLGYNVKLFRFPGGSSNHESMKYCDGIITALASWANETGLKYFDWNVVSGDGNVNTPVADMISTIQSSPQYDVIYLLCHDSGAANNTVTALPTIIEYYLARGYEFKILTDSTPDCHHTIAN